MASNSRLGLLESLDPCQTFGKVTKVVGLIAEGHGIRAPLGSVCYLIPEESPPIAAEVVGFRDGACLFMPYSDMRGIGPGNLIQNAATPPHMPVAKAMLGRALDCFGTPMDGKGPITPDAFVPLHREPPNPLERPRINEPLDVGIRSVNALLTLGKGQRVGIMAGSGVGKSTTLGMMARYTKADINVIALVGERGREVVEFMERDLGPEGMARSVLVVATSDKSPLIRMRAAYAATAVAEYFRDQGKDVLLMMDSVTRFAMAGREVGLAAGEPPTRGGYTPSVFAHLPQLLERAGKSAKGSITGIYTVLVDGDDFTEPIADSTRSILDGHIVLTRELADLGHYPAIDVLRSVSRLRGDITTNQAQADGQALLRHMATFKRVEDMVNIGAYQKGANVEVDKAIAMVAPINGFLRQLVTEREPLDSAFAKLHGLVAGNDPQPQAQPKQNAPQPQARPPKPPPLKRVPPPPSSIPVRRK
ncbi:MAG: FliI/YscN family ATPase [Pseudodesulfovibrio sp.]|uniref:ATPase, FliI/YscN family n=1 Tax=Pseudodesulfovibrio aespoeensis (strain ATCC 700646 / DSM 10631 / Aspo-2) TaxID=643562 RepID=E6VRI6_PSEA9|nr:MULTISPECIES: FliI/YscN family ATPase [Pseudodesulfovibrio]MBU4244152.1 FliI/YscN family ATPase [Pseudomonadota bacterium]MCG2731920.1 FliI/YscN family ATPase [Pseudodesulfovibrio aespoeensis]ADU63023.1 ATPase, FliI/YscN family [Pseudodesulfovibrio aespoeensis Aspo-2]MBU4377934.1 FliI/YscN family ATPase [Pseudomonadota bacterium]MBU4475872.1 FliI/YscN family ATPase [Pseudomonadota bacterium]